MIVNRYWNQLDEDVRVLLQRFDAEAAQARDGKLSYHDIILASLTVSVGCL